METRKLSYLVAEAVALGGGNLCAAGHEWESYGGRACPFGSFSCSQPVYRCTRCGDYDYGEKGGPAHDECTRCKRAQRHLHD